MYTLNCRGKILVFDKPAVMGILNLTNDSFFEGYLESSEDQIIDKIGGMVSDGADLLDIGGQSTRPGSKRIGAEEEAGRVIPVIQSIVQKFPNLLISIDTYHAEVAKAAVSAGASIVNDISAGEMDEAMIPTVADLKCPFICMHMAGRPETMQENPQYDNLIETLLQYFRKKIEECTNAGIKDIILDPGFGFGKNISHNFDLLNRFSELKIFGLPLLAGLSRKSTIYKTLGTDAAGSLNGTTVLNTIALLNGANILRVHDVKEAVEVVKLVSSVYHK